MNELKLLKNY